LRICDETGLIHDLTTGRDVGAIPGDVYSRFAPDGKTIAVISQDGTLQFWDLPLGRSPWRIGTQAILAALVLFLLLQLTAWMWRRTLGAKS
jgi:WD40 repeat protein